MQINEDSLKVVRDVISATLSPENKTRKDAEAYLISLETQVGFLPVVLTLIHSLTGSVGYSNEFALRQSCAVLFKNCIKKYWEPDETGTFSIHQVDRDSIKTYVIDLMCSTTPEVQRQLAEAVSIIAKYDFYSKWTTLLPQLVSKLNNDDLYIRQGVMLTANSIMKKFRYSQRSDELYNLIIHCGELFQVPLLVQYQKNGALISALSSSPDKKNELIAAMETQRIMTRIYFSFNWQDIPQYFEDNITIWMGEFAKFLSYKNPLLVDTNEDNEAGPIEKLQVAIVENLNLYATKYEEDFAPFLSTFTMAIWQLLIEIGSQPKYDTLITSAIKFLSSVVSKQMNTALFNEQALSDIIQHIVIKNLTVTDNDEELFEDNPMEYIRKDVEGSDQDTRRRSAVELIRGLLKFFNDKTSQFCLRYTGEMLENYRISNNWKLKDAALHLVLAVSVKSSTASFAAGELNPLINVFDIFNAHVFPELLDANINNVPILKADALKLLCFFRTHLPPQLILDSIPHIIKYLNSSNVVVQTYASLCIERFLSLKNNTTNTTLLTKEHLSSHLQSLFTALFAVLNNPELPANYYVMKCIVKVLLLIDSDILPVVPTILSSLNYALERAYKNPLNAMYNHNLFECMAVLIDNATKANPAITEQFESVLFSPFQVILGQDMSEFTPYVLQIFAQLLLCSNANKLSEAYKVLFTPLLSPLLWERKAYIPALTDLFVAYINNGINDIVTANQLMPLLGVFQKLLSLKTTEVYAFKILDLLITKTGISVMSQYNNVIIQLLLQRMQEYMRNNTGSGTIYFKEYIKMFVHTLMIYSGTYGGDTLFVILNSIDANIFLQIINNIFIDNISITIENSLKYELRNIIIGAINVLVLPSINSDIATWKKLFANILLLIKTYNNSSNSNARINSHAEDGNLEVEYDGGAYCKLSYLKSCQPVVNQSDDVIVIFSKNMQNICTLAPGKYPGIILEAVASNNELYALFDTIVKSNNIRIF